VGIKPERIRSFLAKFLRVIGEEISSSLARLLLFDENTGIAFENFWPAPDETFTASTRDLIDRAVQERRPVLTAAGEPACAFDCQESPGSATQSFLCLPLIAGNRLVGAICLGRKPGLEPFSSADLELLAFLARSLEPALRNGLIRYNAAEEGEPGRESVPLIGQSRACSLVRTLIEKVKNTDAPVFIYGESGTGKELIARSIHERGARRNGPFVAVNCSAIPDPLLESELFGHARGAFTGALRDRAGLIEEANGGTFFLDEIGDLSLTLQAKLLRLLQEKEIRRVGETRMRPVNARFVSATNKNIEKEIERGNFRIDLYYRLRILTIEVAPLRERKGDLLLLVEHFLEKYCREMGRPRAYFSPRALELLMNYSWPGNIRELQNEVQRCLILSGDEVLIKEDFLSTKVNPEKQTSPVVSYDFFEAKAEFEKRFLHQALLRFGRNKSRTAGEIGLSRQGLFKLMKKHNL
jgi:transcriptional regulator with GAF, ATPase, and Fis domain